MKRILVVFFSQSGQMASFLKSFLSPLYQNSSIEITWERLEPVNPYPFPWSLYDFLSVFPESVLKIPPALTPFKFDPEVKYDLIILAYTVWYLSPSPPTTAFLRSPEAKIIKDVPVITVVNARDKWLTAQENVKAELDRIGAKLIDHVAFIHQGNGFQHLVTTLRWMLTGKKNAFWGVFPPAGVDEKVIQDAARFGYAIADALNNGRISKGQPIFQKLEPVKVDAECIIQERIAYTNFVFWAKIIAAAGSSRKLTRSVLLLVFSLCLMVLILLSAPVIVFYRLFLAPFMKKKMDRLINYYSRNVPMK